MCNSKFMELSGTLLLRKERREKKGDKHNGIGGLCERSQGLALLHCVAMLGLQISGRRHV